MKMKNFEIGGNEKIIEGNCGILWEKKNEKE